jgi:hypothetical protein
MSSIGTHRTRAQIPADAQNAAKTKTARTGRASRASSSASSSTSGSSEGDASSKASSRTSASPASLKLESPRGDVGVSAAHGQAAATPHAALFSDNVSLLAQKSRIARNVLPMFVRGGVMASVGMLLFGHLAPIAIVGVLAGAAAGGYFIAKFLQRRVAKQYGEQVETLAQSMAAIGKYEGPDKAYTLHGAPVSAADVAKGERLLAFLKEGEVWHPGLKKAVVQPYQVLRRMLSGQKPDVQEAPASAAGTDMAERETAPLPRAQSVHSSIDTWRKDVAGSVNGSDEAARVPLLSRDARSDAGSDDGSSTASGPQSFSSAVSHQSEPAARTGMSTKGLEFGSDAGSETASIYTAEGASEHVGTARLGMVPQHSPKLVSPAEKSPAAKQVRFAEKAEIIEGRAVEAAGQFDDAPEAAEAAPTRRNNEA